MAAPAPAQVETTVRRIVAEVLGEPMVGVDAFPAGGFDSLSAVELANRMGEALSIVLPGTLVFDYPSVSSMAQHICDFLAPAAEQQILAVPEAARQVQELISLSVAARLPGSASVGDSISSVPYGRWDLEASRRGHFVERARFGGFIADESVFDASLFGISRAEADLVDPQQRLLLETTWEAIAAAVPGVCGPNTGVYVGIQQMEYNGLAAPHLATIGPFSATGSSFSVAAGRLAFTHGFHGPAMSLDTACSSALVATHLAAAYARGAAGGAALAAGVNLMLSESTTAATRAAGMLAADGRCKTLDANADGYVRAEACVAYVISPANGGGAVLLRATFVNQDGRSSSLTAPNGPAQQAVIRGALAAATMEPHFIGELEMHGTGTALGDPIEVGAALAVLRRGEVPLRFSATKSRMGHAEPVAGAVGLASALAALESSRAVPSLHLRHLNPLVASLVENFVNAAQLPPLARAHLPSRAQMHTPLW
jgi:acyl transferase domain-containing protein/acyl carrier protein